MQHFESDYLEGAHPLILERLMQTNMEKTPGYGTDCYCEVAREKIRRACNAPDAEVHFMVGGTQTNATMITAMLRPYEGPLRLAGIRCWHCLIQKASFRQRMLTVT